MFDRVLNTSLGESWRTKLPFSRNIIQVFLSDDNDATIWTLDMKSPCLKTNKRAFFYQPVHFFNRSRNFYVQILCLLVFFILVFYSKNSFIWLMKWPFTWWNNFSLTFKLHRSSLHCSFLLVCFSKHINGNRFCRKNEKRNNCWFQLSTRKFYS